jgi:hypothetical protein
MLLQRGARYGGTEFELANTFVTIADSQHIPRAVLELA